MKLRVSKITRIDLGIIILVITRRVWTGSMTIFTKECNMFYDVVYGDDINVYASHVRARVRSILPMDE